MDLNSFDLRTFKAPLEEALSAYEQILGMEFQDFPDISRTPEKPNSARTVIPLRYEEEKIGDLYTIVFVKGDGTGDSKTYKLDDLTLPSEYQHTQKQERVIPRAKAGVLYEGFFPLFSMNSERDIALFAASLDELSVRGNTIAPLWRLGQTDADFTKALSREISLNPQIYLTVGETPQGKRVGDPHAIYYSKTIADAVQVVGFLSITDSQNPFLKSAKNWILPSE